MWFLFVLLVLTAIYSLWREITKADSVQQYIPKEFPIPRYLYLLLFEPTIANGNDANGEHHEILGHKCDWYSKRSVVDGKHNAD